MPSHAVPLGAATVVRPGTDVTVVSTYLSLRGGGHFSVTDVAKSFAEIFILGVATRD